MHNHLAGIDPRVWNILCVGPLQKFTRHVLGNFTIEHIKICIQHRVEEKILSWVGFN